MFIFEAGTHLILYKDDNNRTIQIKPATGHNKFNYCINPQDVPYGYNVGDGGWIFKRFMDIGIASWYMFTKQ